MAATTLGKKDLVDLIAKKGDFSKKNAELALNAFIDSVTEGLADGHSVRIIPFGSFAVRDRKARAGRDPRTGAKIKISAKKIPVFKPGKGLKDNIK
jgi:DNA-binding protein HU-beta